MSNSDAHDRITKRNYRLGKRADQKEKTRLRIVQAAVELHSTIGPAQTSVAQIAERAGVQRHTYYAHFPSEWDLVLACSGLALAQDPLPDPEELRRFTPGAPRLKAGLGQFYHWYARNEQLSGCVLRDAEHHALTRDIVELRMRPVFTSAAEIMSECLNARAITLLGVALEFFCWRSLAGHHDPGAAAALMTEAIMQIGENDLLPDQ